MYVAISIGKKKHSFSRLKDEITFISKETKTRQRAFLGELNSELTNKAKLTWECTAAAVDEVEQNDTAEADNGRTINSLDL